MMDRRASDGVVRSILLSPSAPVLLLVLVFPLLMLGLRAVAQDDGLTHFGASGDFSFKIPGPDSLADSVDVGSAAAIADTISPDWAVVRVPLLDIRRITSTGDTVYVFPFTPPESGRWRVRVRLVGRDAVSPWSPAADADFDLEAPGAPQVSWEDPQ